MAANDLKRALRNGQYWVFENTKQTSDYDET